MKRGELLNRKLRKSAVLLIAALVAAVTLDPGLAAGTVLAAEAKNGIEAVPVTVDSDFSFVNGEEYIIVSAGSSNPYPFALKNSLKSSMRLYAGQVEYNEETGVLELTETGEDISDYIWEAVDADETNTRLKNRSTGKFFNFSSVSFSLADTGTVISAGYDGRIYLGATNGYDYYLSCRYFEYDNPADYYYGFATASSSSDAGGMAMSVYKVSCSHENSIFSRNAAVTCTEDGYDEYICQDCGKILKQNIVSATGHNFVNGKCTVCGIRNVWDGISATG